jgi:hypothetical protein
MQAAHIKNPKPQRAYDGRQQVHCTRCVLVKSFPFAAAVMKEKDVSFLA